jgi:hypothetical protein
MARPARQMQRALAHWPGPAGHHPGDPAAPTDAAMTGWSLSTVAP